MDVGKLKKYAEKVKHKTSHLLDEEMVARVAGVTFEDRQEVLALVDEGTPVKLIRDRRNEYDFYAVGVWVEIEGVWKQAGFIPNPMCKKVSKSMDNGVKFSSSVHRVKGGMKSDYTGELLNYGLEVNVVPER